MGTLRTLRQAAQALPPNEPPAPDGSNQPQNDVDHVVSARDELTAPAQLFAPPEYDLETISRIVRSSAHSRELAELVTSAEQHHTTVAYRRMLFTIVAGFVMLVGTLLVVGVTLVEVSHCCDGFLNLHIFH